MPQGTCGTCQRIPPPTYAHPLPFVSAGMQAKVESSREGWEGPQKGSFLVLKGAGSLVEKRDAALLSAAAGVPGSQGKAGELQGQGLGVPLFPPPRLGQCTRQGLRTGGGGAAAGPVLGGSGAAGRAGGALFGVAHTTWPQGRRSRTPRSKAGSRRREGGL